MEEIKKVNEHDLFEVVESIANNFDKDLERAMNMLEGTNVVELNRVMLRCRNITGFGNSVIGNTKHLVLEKLEAEIRRISNSQRLIINKKKEI